MTANQTANAARNDGLQLIITSINIIAAAIFIFIFFIIIFIITIMISIIFTPIIFTIAVASLLLSGIEKSRKAEVLES